jgi:hypothetical protein
MQVIRERLARVSCEADLLRRLARLARLRDKRAKLLEETGEYV